MNTATGGSQRRRLVVVNSDDQSLMSLSLYFHKHRIRDEGKEGHARHVRRVSPWKTAQHSHVSQEAKTTGGSLMGIQEKADHPGETLSRRCFPNVMEGHSSGERGGVRTQGSGQGKEAQVATARKAAAVGLRRFPRVPDRVLRR